MSISRNELIIGGIAAAIFLIAAGVWLAWPRVQAPIASDTAIATSTSSIATTTKAAEPPATGPFPINPADANISWDFTGQYANSAELLQQAKGDITHLNGLIGKGQYDDYDVFIGLGNDYTHLGDGKVAYNDYNRAIRIHPKKSLAYANLGVLTEQMHAYNTAADAYAKAVAVEPALLSNHVARLTCLTTQFPKDNAHILAAFTDASKQFGDTPSILSIEAEWLTSVGRYADAIRAWQAVRTLSSADRQAAIDAEIARLKTKQ